MRSLGQYPWLLVPLGILVGYLVLRVGLGTLRMLGASPPQTAEAASRSTDDVEAFDLRYRCQICGTEMRLTRLARSDADEDFDPPKHCREDMSLVVEADADV